VSIERREARAGGWGRVVPIFENTLLKKLCNECENAFTHCFLKKGAKFSLSSGFLMYGIAMINLISITKDQIVVSPTIPILPLRITAQLVAVQIKEFLHDVSSRILLKKGGNTIALSLRCVVRA